MTNIALSVVETSAQDICSYITDPEQSNERIFDKHIEDRLEALGYQWLSFILANE